MADYGILGNRGAGPATANHRLPEAMLITIALWLVAFPITWGSGAKGSWAGMARSKKQSWTPATSDALNISATFSETARRVSSKEFKGGNIKD